MSARIFFDPRVLAPLLLSGAILLAGCESLPERAPDLVLSNGSSGGSALATSPDSRLIAAGSLNGLIRLWQLPDGKAAGQWLAHRTTVNGIVFLDDGSRLLSAGYDGRIVIWTDQGRLIREWDSGSPVTALAASPDRDVVVSGHADGSVRLWQAEGGQIAEWTAVHRGMVRAVALGAAGDRVASSGTDGHVYWWHRQASPQRLADPPSDARTLVFAPGDASLLGAGWFRLFRWQLADGAFSSLATEHAGIINDLALTPNGRVFSISRQTDSAVLLLDAETGQTLQRFQRHDLCGVAVSPSPDGRFLTTTSDDASVRIWRLQDHTSE
jgi:WD40 repeat protein